jgi:multidrug resistance efflux pump
MKKHIDYYSVPTHALAFSKMLFILFVFSIFVLCMPWVQNTTGVGTVTSQDPAKRLQNIVAPIQGRITQWYVPEGTFVKQGDPIVSIQDIDPDFPKRLQLDVYLSKQKVATAQANMELLAKNAARQQLLYKEGIASQKDRDMAEANYQKSVSDVLGAKSQLWKSQNAVAKQSNQIIVAPFDGTLVQAKSSAFLSIVKAGDVLGTFVPAETSLAAELYINARDMALLAVGQKVRLSFYGWPSIQLGGWPELAIGTFGGVIKNIDAVSLDPKFIRIFVVPDTTMHPWPSSRFIKMGSQVYGYILFNKVRVAYELWRQLNGLSILNPTIFGSYKDAKVDPLSSVDGQNKDSKAKTSDESEK